MTKVRRPLLVSLFGFGALALTLSAPAHAGPAGASPPARDASRIENRLERAEANDRWQQGSRADRAEDRFDTFEDRLDRRESRRDERVDQGRRDVAEDKWDRREGRRDRRENRLDRAD